MDSSLLSCQLRSSTFGIDIWESNYFTIDHKSSSELLDTELLQESPNYIEAQFSLSFQRRQTLIPILAHVSRVHHYNLYYYDSLYYYHHIICTVLYETHVVLKTLYIIKFTKAKILTYETTVFPGSFRSMDVKLSLSR